MQNLQVKSGPQRLDRLDRLGWPRRVLTHVTGKVGVADERYRGLLTAHDPYADKYLNSHMISELIHLQIGSLLFEGIDQIDVTGPFEVFSRLPNSTYRLFATTRLPVRDTKGLRLLPDDRLSNAPQLDLLHVPGGPGQEALMENEEVLAWLRKQAAGASLNKSQIKYATVLQYVALRLKRT